MAQINRYEAIARFRAGRPPLNLARALLNARITTCGRDTAVANTEFRRAPSEIAGRKVVCAHVSVLA
jgi:hypothetical protein